jgi:DNA topoisomerase II
MQPRPIFTFADAEIEASTNASRYTQLTDKEQILTAPEMHIDSVVPLPRKEFVIVNGTIQLCTVNIPIGAIRVFMEVLANALDNFSRSSRAGVDPGRLAVTFDGRRISVYNEGLTIPLETHPDTGIFIPIMLFSHLRTSSNYTEERHEIGRNGFGAKLTGIFSLYFCVEVYCAVTGRYWKGEWRNNMNDFTEHPTVSSNQGPKSYVRVTYELDLKRFRLVEYPPEASGIIARLCADASFTNKIPATFNETPFNFSSIKEYSKLLFPPTTKSITYYVWPPGVTPIIDSDGSQRPPNGYTLPQLEVTIFDTPGKSAVLSFVNSLMVVDGGIHVENTVKCVSKFITQHVNSEAKIKKKDEKATHKVTLSDVRPNISVIISIRVKNPIFNSQSKTFLRGADNGEGNSDIPIKLPPDLLKETLDWQLHTYLKTILNAKGKADLKKTDGKKVKYINEPDLLDANLAGTSQSSKCTLCIMEGKSAKAYGLMLRSYHPSGTGGDYIGLLPIRGKLINAMTNSPEDIAANKEIQLIKKALGLREDLDYRASGNRDTLRYGDIMIMADQDVDGRHIKGLILTYFIVYFPSLLEIGFIKEWCTPFMRVDHNTAGIHTRFFYPQEYKGWVAQNTEIVSKYEIEYKYCKGLGSSSKEEAIKDIQDPKVVTILADNLCNEYMKLGFDGDKRYCDLRKKWMEIYDENKPMTLSTDGQQCLSIYVNEELIQYSIANLIRHIPSWDGLKPCQRKLLYTAFKKFGRTLNAKKRTAKVGTFCAATIEATSYKHGDSLPGVMVGMCANFVGANNMEYFKAESMMGTRMEGGKDAAQPRYTSFSGEWWLPEVMMPVDDAQLEHLIDEDEEIEWKHYLPILPMFMINGVKAVGSGHSSFIPNFDPLDVVHALKEGINGRPIPNIIPTYKGFTGSITVVDKRRVEPIGVKLTYLDDSDDEESEDEIFNFDTSGKRGEDGHASYDPIRKIDAEGLKLGAGSYRMITRGVYHVDERTGLITITELPIGVWTKDYLDWLVILLSKKYITGMRDLSTDIKVHIEITGFTGRTNDKPYDHNNPPQVNEKTLRLVRRYGLSNMIILDENYKPIKFSSPSDMISKFIGFLTPYYASRKDMLIKKYTQDIEEKTNEIKFMWAVMSGQLKLWKEGGGRRTKGEIVADITALSLDPKFLKKSMVSFTEEKLAKLLAQREALIKTLEELLKKEPSTLWQEDLDRFEVKYSAKEIKSNPRASTNPISMESINSYQGPKTKKKKMETPIPSQDIPPNFVIVS